MPENLFLAYQRGAGRRYYDLGLQYLDDKTWFDPLSRNENVLNGRHAYSYVNSLSSAMMAYLVAGSEKHLRAAQNAFAMLEAQSFATGGWGPDETLRAPGSSDVYDSLTNTHHSFETPCGGYAHFKLTRYLLRVTRDARYGDSMERMMYNTVLGAMPLRGKRRRTSTTPITTSTGSACTRKLAGRAARAHCRRWRRITASICISAGRRQCM